MKRLLVTGATGRQGGAVSRAALAAGWSVRALVRDAGTPAASALSAAGAEVARGDLDQPATLQPALDGISHVFSVQALAPQHADREAAQGMALACAAEAAGVEHFVYSAALWTDRETGVPHLDSKFRVRNALAAAGMPATVLEPGSFMENLLYPQTVKGARGGKLVTPLATGVVQPLLAVDDIGPAALWCLENPEASIARVFPLYAETLTVAQQAEAIGVHLGRDMRCSRLPRLLTRLFLGRDLSRMFRFLDDQPAFPPSAEIPMAWTRFSDWLDRVDYAR
jgi:uncharacterized protein YbjT (DUF2867 family)